MQNKCTVGGGKGIAVICLVAMVSIFKEGNERKPLLNKAEVSIQPSVMSNISTKTLPQKETPIYVFFSSRITPSFNTLRKAKP